MTITVNSVLSAKILKGLTNSRISSPPIIIQISNPISESSFRVIVLSSLAIPNDIKAEIEQDAIHKPSLKQETE